MERSRVRAIAGRAVRTSRARWESVQPFPLPRYPAVTPTTDGEDPLHPFLPPTIQTLAAAATSEEAAQAVLATLAALSPSDFHVGQQIYMEWGRARYGAYWQLANLATVLWAATRLIHPKNYLKSASSAVAALPSWALRSRRARSTASTAGSKTTPVRRTRGRISCRGSYVLPDIAAPSRW